MKNRKYLFLLITLLSVFYRVNNTGRYFDFQRYLNNRNIVIQKPEYNTNDSANESVQPKEELDIPDGQVDVSKEQSDIPDEQVDTPNKQVDSKDESLNGLSVREKEMLKYVNEERTKAGLKPLQVDLELSRVARIKSQDMVDNGYFSHNSPTYGSPFEMITDFGIKYRAAGENIARNSSVLKAHESLMNSEGHRKNILNENFTHIGIGIVDNKGAGGITVTQMFITK